jgi:hypothetical protein
MALARCEGHPDPRITDRTSARPAKAGLDTTTLVLIGIGRARSPGP